MVQWVDFANTCYRPAGLRFLYEPERDFTDLRSTLLNGVTGNTDPDWLEARAEGNRVAATHPDALVVFFRHGPDAEPTGAGFSWWTYDFIVMPGWAVAEHCGVEKPKMLSHEIGHYLGLPHTFAGMYQSEVGAELAFERSELDPGCFDGDGFTDTPPDPLVRPYECEDVDRIALMGETFVLPRTNIMSYYFEAKSLSPQQAARARWIAAYRREHGMSTPSHAGVDSPIELESLKVIRTSGPTKTDQPMDGFGRELWSDGTQMFFGDSEAPSHIRLELPVDKPGWYDVTLYGTRAPDYGEVTVLINGRRCGHSFNAYAPLVLPSGAIPLGSVRLRRSNVIEFRTDTRDEASKGYLMGLDCLQLKRN